MSSGVKTGFNKLILYCFAVVSFSPLFAVIYGKKICGIVCDISCLKSIECWITNLDLVLVLLFTIFSFAGFFITLHYIETDVNNGKKYTIISVKNHNKESMVYMVTYLLPILGIPDSYGRKTFLILIAVFICIYCQSSMIAVNPIVSVFRHINKVRYRDKSGVIKSAVIISKDDIRENDQVIMKKIGSNLYYSGVINDNK